MMSCSLRCCRTRLTQSSCKHGPAFAGDASMQFFLLLLWLPTLRTRTADQQRHALADHYIAVPRPCCSNSCPCAASRGQWGMSRNMVAQSYVMLAAIHEVPGQCCRRAVRLQSHGIVACRGCRAKLRWFLDRQRRGTLGSQGHGTMLLLWLFRCQCKRWRGTMVSLRP